MKKKRKIGHGMGTENPQAEESKDPVTLSLESKESQYLFYLIILAFVLLMLPHVLRFIGGNTALMDSQAYYHMISAQSILEGRDTDGLTYTPREFVRMPYHYLLAYSGKFFDMNTLSRIFPFAFGILSLIVFYHLLKEFGIQVKGRFVASLLLIISPPFLYLFSVSTPNCLTVFATLLGIFLVLKKNIFCFMLSLLCLSIVAFSSIFNILFAFSLLAFVFMMDEANRKRSLIAAILMAVIYIVSPSEFYYNFDVYHTQFFKYTIYGLGAKTGMGVFSVLLAVIGIFHSWKNKGRFSPLYMGLLFLLASTIYAGGEINLYTNFIITVFAALGLHRIGMIKWTFVPVKNLTFVILGCGFLFSTLSCLKMMPSLLPDGAMIDSMVWLKDNSAQGSIVLTHPSRGYWVEQVAGRRVIADGLSGSTPSYSSRISDINSMFYSVDLDDTMESMREYNASYILIDSEMREGLVWTGEKEGLLFLLRNNDTFRKVHSDSGVELWEVRLY